MLKLGALLASALVLSPMVSYGDTLCSRNSMSGEWRLQATTEGGNGLACDLTFANAGNFTGNCYTVVDLDRPPPRATYLPATGQLRLLSTCVLRGTIELGTAPQLVSMTLTGRAWSAANPTPMFAALSGQYTRANVPVVLGVRLMRRVYAPHPDVPTQPDG